MFIVVFFLISQFDKRYLFHCCSNEYQKHEVFFLSFEHLEIKYYLIDQFIENTWNIVKYFLFGFLVVKQRMQMINSPYKSALQCVSHIYKSEGLRAFYRSYTTQLTMNVPFQSIHFMVYEFSQQVINKKGAYNPPAHMVSGALAGGIAAAITTPLDVCKTLLNTQQMGVTRGLVEAVKTVYRLGGTAGYFRGLYYLYPFWLIFSETYTYSLVNYISFCLQPIKMFYFINRPLETILRVFVLIKRNYIGLI